MEYALVPRAHDEPPLIQLQEPESIKKRNYMRNLPKGFSIELAVACLFVCLFACLFVGLVWFGLVCFGLVWFGLFWFGLFWFVLLWFVVFCFGCLFVGLLWLARRYNGCHHCPLTREIRY